MDYKAIYKCYSIMVIVIVVILNVYQFVSVWVELTYTGATVHFLIVNSVPFLCCIKVLLGKKNR